MKRNQINPCLIAILVITVLSLAGCGGGEPTSPSTTSPGITTTPNTVTTNPPTSQTPSGGSLSEILGRAKNVNTMKYDMVVTMPGAGTQPVTTTTWVKKNKARSEMSAQGITSVVSLFDVDAKVMYMYMPDQNMAMKQSLNPAMSPLPQDAGSIETYAPKIVGTETIDGKACIVIEYTPDQAVTKMWIWKDRGLPVKAEIPSAEGKTIVEYKNYDFSDIPDSMFDLPPGVQIIENGPTAGK